MECRRPGSNQGLALSLLGAVLLGILCGRPAVQAQSRSIRFDRLSLEQGLSQSTINCILQDRRGFLWFGTQEGLNRYDGYEFRVYKKDPTDPTSLAGNWITALVEDPAGDLWIGTEGGGLSRWQRASDTFVHYRHDPGDPASLPSNRVQTLLLDRQGVLWVGTFQSGLARLDRAASGSRTFARFRHAAADAASLSDDRVRSIYEDRAGNLWIGTLAGLDRFVGAAPGRVTGHFVRSRHDPSDPTSLSDDRVTAILEDHLGRLWIGTEKGLNRRDPAASGFVRYVAEAADPASLTHDLVWALFEDRDQRLWIGTDGGLYLLAGSAGGFTHYRHDAADPDSLSNDRVTAILQDRGGVVWVGTQGGGLSKWNPLTWAFAHYRADPASAHGLASNAVYAFSEDAASGLWIGTFGGGLSLFERSTGRFTHYRHDPQDPDSLADDRVLALVHDRGGALWVGTATGGLDRFEASTARFRHYRHDPARADSLADDNVTSLFVDREGALWIGTFRGGLNRLDEAESGRFARFRHDPADPASLSEDQVTAFADGAGGTLWIGTFGGGLNRYAGATAFERFRHDPARPSSLSSDSVYALHVDAAGVLWIGTQVGLNKLERAGAAPGEAAFGHYFERHGLPSESVWGVYSDARGDLWLSTNNGLARFDPRAETFTSYDRSHGLQGNEFNFGAHFQSASGELFFGGTNGFNAFYPERIERNASPPPVVLTAFTKLNRPVPLERPIFDVEEVALDYRDDIVSFEFAALDYTAPEKNRYRYKLEGFHDEWVDNGHRRRVSFTDLDPGDYVLRVLGANNDGVWNEAGTALKITVAPPPWRTWWAYTLYVAALAAAVGGFVASQHRKVERERAIARRERAQAEERARLLEEREQLIAELEEKNAELESFNYTVSHDLKNPLVTIKGFLGLLKQDAAAGDQKSVDHDISRIGSAADHMYRLLDELLELSRLGRWANPMEKVALGEVVHEALALVDGHLGARAAEVSIAPDLPAVVGDRQRLLQVYQNLLANAVKYMGEQSSPRIEVGVRRADRYRRAGPPVFFVRDNGIGIETPYHDKVFGLFERLDAGDEGTGVGLALVKRIVEMHGGRIWVESQGLGHGSTFCFTLGKQDLAEEALPVGPRPS